MSKRILVLLILVACMHGAVAAMFEGRVFLDANRNGEYDAGEAGMADIVVSDSDNRPRAVIIGIGMNLCTERFPEEFAASAGNLGDIEINALCGTVTAKLIDCYAHLDDNSILEKYKERSFCIGRTIRYTQNEIIHIATAIDIDDGGGLIVEENGTLTTLNSGEISIMIG